MSHLVKEMYGVALFCLFSKIHTFLSLIKGGFLEDHNTGASSHWLGSSCVYPFAGTKVWRKGGRLLQHTLEKRLGLALCEEESGAAPSATVWLSISLG